MKYVVKDDILAGTTITVCVLLAIVATCISDGRGVEHLSTPPMSLANKLSIARDTKFAEALTSDPVAFYTRGLYYATVVLATFTIMLAVVTVLIWIDGKRAGSQQRIDFKKSLDEAIRGSNSSAAAAEAARQSLIDSRQRTERELRPWLTIEHARLMAPIDAVEAVGGTGLSLIVRLTIKNSGRSLATSVWTSIIAKSLDDTDLLDFRDKHVAQELSTSRSRGLAEGQLIAPGLESDVLHEYTISGAKLKRPQENIGVPSIIAISCMVTYRDAGSPEILRHTSMVYAIGRQVEGFITDVDLTTLPIRDVVMSVMPGFAHAT